MKKKITIYYLAILISIINPISVFADINVNLKEEQKNYLMSEYAKMAKNDKNERPLVIDKDGSLDNTIFKSPLIIAESVSGDLIIKNSTFYKDIYIFSDSFKKLSFKNTTIYGNIYVIASSYKSVIEFQNTKLKNIFVNSPVQIDKKDKLSIINDIVISKDIPTKSNIKINASINSLINNADAINLTVNGNMNAFKDNANAILKGKNSYKLKAINVYPDTFVYDFADFKEEKGYNDIQDKTSYQDMYNLLKLYQDKRKDKISIVVKNISDENLTKFENTIVEKFLRFLPNNSYGIYSTIFSDYNGKYAIYNMYFMYDTDDEEDKKAKNSINSIYNTIKDLDDIEYIKSVNKVLSYKIKYDTSLSRYSMYDAVINSSAVCEGYAKAGYELLGKKFGKENNLIIVNDTHMWNMLRLNGKWYHIDFTHNDTGEFDNIGYSEQFLLLNDEQLKANDPDRTWDSNIYPKAP